MKIFGLPIPFTGESQKALSAVSDNRGWWPVIREPFGGAWQRNISIDHNRVQAFHANFSCQTLIASDVAKLRVKLVEQSEGGVWSETKNPAYDPVLRKPNDYQNRIQFWECWILSKLNRGNAYILKGRDGRGVVSKLWVLDPNRVSTLVADDGSVFYRLSTDSLNQITKDVTVPAREIIHDRMNCLFHPLVGISPIFAAGIAATQGLNIQTSSLKLFENNSAPGGILSAPSTIDDVTAARLKADWEANYSGKNIGKVAVLGDGLKYEKMTLTAVEGQLIEQLKWSAEVVCSCYHVPPYKVGIGAMPPYSNVQALNVEYYSQALQILIEAAELCLDEGLEMGVGTGTEFDVRGLLRMDSVTQITALRDAVGASIMAPNEARKEIDLPPVPGGASPLSQEQYYSLAALAKRDSQDDPFAHKSPAPTPPPSADAPPDNSLDDAAAKDFGAWRLQRSLDAFPPRLEIAA